MAMKGLVKWTDLCPALLHIATYVCMCICMYVFTRIAHVYRIGGIIVIIHIHTYNCFLNHPYWLL